MAGLKLSYEHIAALQQPHIVFGSVSMKPAETTKSGKWKREMLVTVTAWPPDLENSDWGTKGFIVATFWKDREKDAEDVAQFIDAERRYKRLVAEKGKEAPNPSGWMHLQGLREDFWQNGEGVTIRVEAVDFTNWRGLPPPVADTTNEDEKPF